MHLLAFGALYGGHVYGVSTDRLDPALLATLATGGALVALELYHAPIWLVQLRGAATIVKVVLTSLVVFAWDMRLTILTVAVVIGSVSSHMPGRFRYYSLLHRRVVGEQERG